MYISVCIILENTFSSYMMVNCSEYFSIRWGYFFSLWGLCVASFGLCYNINIVFAYFMYNVYIYIYIDNATYMYNVW